MLQIAPNQAAKSPNLTSSESYTPPEKALPKFEYQEKLSPALEQKIRRMAFLAHTIVIPDYQYFAEIKRADTAERAENEVLSMLNSTPVQERAQLLGAMDRTFVFDFKPPKHTWKSLTSYMEDNLGSPRLEAFLGWLESV